MNERSFIVKTRAHRADNRAGTVTDARNAEIACLAAFWRELANTGRWATTSYLGLPQR